MSHSFSLRARRFWREDGVFLLLMSGLFVLRYWPAFAHGWLYAPFQDNVWLYGSLFSRESEIALTGNFPYWIDTLLGGFPVYQTPDHSATYPFYFFGLLNYGKALQVLYTLSYLTCFHNFILYINLYVLARVAGANGLASLCGATVGLVSGNTEVYSHWITLAGPWSWFPLLIAGMIRLVRVPLSLGSTALFAIPAALICMASPSQPVIQSTFIGIIFFTSAVLWQWRKQGIAAVGRLFLGISISAVVAFCLSAVAFVPMILATRDMIRFVGHHPPVIGHASIPWEAFNDNQLEPRQLIHLLFDSSDPRAGPGGLYVGPLGVFGLLLCVTAYRRAGAIERFLILTFGLMASYFLIAGFGTHFGLAYVHFHIPLLNLIREATRHLVIFTTFVALLAALGLQSLLDVITGKIDLTKGWQRFFRVITAFGLVLFLAALAVDHRRVISGWPVLLVLPLGLVLLPASSRQVGVVGPGLLFLACLASMLSPPGTLPFFVSEYLRPDNLTSHRVLRRIAQLPDISKYRVVFQTGTKRSRKGSGTDEALGPFLWANNASFYGIRTLYLSFTVLPRAQLHEMFDEQLVNLRKLRGVKYFVCGEDAKPFDPKARLLFTESGYSVYEVSDAMEPYTLVHAVQSFSGVMPFRVQVAQGFDYRHMAAVKRSAKETPSPLLQSMEAAVASPSASEDFLQPIVRTPNRFGVLVDSSQPGVLVFNERWSKDWHATVNSERAKVIRANFTQPAVVLSAGRNYVEFEYKPMLFWWLLILQRATFLVLGLYAIRRLLRGPYAFTIAKYKQGTER
jgi:hypothetical protein